MQYGYVYETKNLVNKKVYIGQHKGDFKEKYLGSGFYLRRAILKYGESNFSIRVIGIASSKIELDAMEVDLIAQYRAVLGRDSVYNITRGGESGSGPRSAEARKKIRDALKGNSNRPPGPCTEETKRRISLANKGRRRTAESRKKMSDSAKREGATGERGRRVAKALRGRKLPEQHKANIKKAMLTMFAVRRKVFSDQDWSKPKNVEFVEQGDLF